MRRVIILFCAVIVVSAAAATGWAVLSSNRVDAAIATVDVSIRDPASFQPFKTMGEKYLALETGATNSDAKELFRRARIEQVYRAALDDDNRKALLGGGASIDDDLELRARLWRRVNERDADNRTWLKGVLKRIGWFRISVYGRPASHTAWLLVQHGDHEPAWQKEVLGVLKAMTAQGEVAGGDVAYLEDRITAAEAKLQTYGTQGVCSEGGWRPFPIADPDHVDDRRRALGLEPMSVYQQSFKVMCKGQ